MTEPRASASGLGELARLFPDSPLVFLRYRFDLDAFMYAKLWLVQGGVLKAVFPDDVAREHLGKSEYAGKPLREVIFRLKDTVGR